MQKTSEVSPITTVKDFFLCLSFIKFLHYTIWIFWYCYYFKFWYRIHERIFYDNESLFYMESFFSLLLFLKFIITLTFAYVLPSCGSMKNIDFSKLRDQQRFDFRCKIKSLCLMFDKSSKNTQRTNFTCGMFSTEDEIIIVTQSQILCVMITWKTSKLKKYFCQYLEYITASLKPNDSLLSSLFCFWCSNWQETIDNQILLILVQCFVFRFSDKFVINWQVK